MLKNIPSTVYKGISFKDGEKPKFNLLKSSFIDQGLFINNKGGSPVIKPVPEYISMIETNINNGNIVSIKETELAQKIETFGNVAQIQSSYQLDFVGKQGSQRRYGVNLFQLINNDGKWLISSMCWDDEPDKSLIAESV
ncbi:hypothetical protein [Agaribacterium sp. ZY112]|uniref:hypothetical protein n=1 Tax=Agaribacterium sp. ZY112 TaxID=3233574 RepID=UPI0035233AA2